MSSDLRMRALQLVSEERDRQNEVWCRTDGVWPGRREKLTVLVEEVGEIARAILENDRKGLKTEVVQAAAVLVAWVECCLADEQEAGRS